MFWAQTLSFLILRSPQGLEFLKLQMAAVNTAAAMSKAAAVSTAAAVFAAAAKSRV